MISFPGYGGNQVASDEINLGKDNVLNQIPDNMKVCIDPIIMKIFSTRMDNVIRHKEDITNIGFFCSEQDNDETNIHLNA